MGDPVIVGESVTGCVVVGATVVGGSVTVIGAMVVRLVDAPVVGATHANRRTGVRLLRSGQPSPSTHATPSPVGRGQHVDVLLPTPIYDESVHERDRTLPRLNPSDAMTTTSRLNMVE
jgi:hypothetical protein